MTEKPRTAVRRTAVVLTLAGLLGGTGAAADASPLRFTPNYGADRYVTSVLAADEPVRTAFVVSGEQFPDGLTAGAVAGTVGGNVFLTRRGELPAAVREQIVYAQKVVVVGGEASVGPEVMTWLQRNTRAQLSRVDGPDRYETAVALSRASYATPTHPDGGVTDVVVATGRDFPDALAGSAAAAHVASPLLLVPGDTVPAAVLAELDRLHPQAITVVGGPGTVSTAVEEQLRAHTSGPVTRVAGADRYETADRVSAAFFPRARTVTLASGQTFPDALAAGALAGRSGGPLLLARRTCLTQGTNLEIERLQATYGEDAALNAFGGPERLTDDALRRTSCQPAGTPTTTYLGSLTRLQGSASVHEDHVVLGGTFYPRTTTFDTDPRNSDAATWLLGTRSTRFTATVGLADDNPSGPTSRVEVLGDERLLASVTVAPGRPVPLDVDVRGVDRLTLVTTTPDASPTPADPDANLLHFGDAGVS